MGKPGGAKVLEYRAPIFQYVWVCQPGGMPRPKAEGGSGAGMVDGAPYSCFDSGLALDESNNPW
jgi:hypothetical protein